MADDTAATRVEQIVTSALELSPSKQLAFIEQQCKDDARLLSEVRALLDAANSPSPLLDLVDNDAFGTIMRDVDREAPEANGMIGREIGAYRIVRLLGEGGMGEVYLAERLGEFEQQVAIKMLRPHVTTADAMRRLVAERQILASLEHPNIARLIDGGTLDDGRPYLVMEYVDGATITDFAKDKALSVVERLDLFTLVSDAVQHAHTRLVVHRDIKPSNILVTPDRVVKLLDFGIARLLDPSGQLDYEQTKTGVRVMTPAYAAPEQVQGRPATAATDVYQLGVLLYELLTGVRPLPGKLSPTEVERYILEIDPIPPSAMVRKSGTDSTGASIWQASSGRVGRQLEGDLDTIVQKAIRKEPEARYGSAEQFGSDVRRFLRGRPITAQPPTWRYRTKKFVRRNGIAVVATVAALAMLVGYAITVTVQQSRIVAERDRATTVTEYLTGAFAELDADRTGRTITIESLLERLQERAEVELANEPAALAVVLGKVGEMHGQRGDYVKGPAVLDRAIELWRLAEPGPDSILAHLLHYRAKITDNTLESLRFFDEATRTLEELNRTDGLFYADVISSTAAHQLFLVDVDSANALAERALEIARRYNGPTNIQLADIYENAGLMEPLDVELLNEALEIRKELISPQSGAVATALNNIALAVEPTQPLVTDSLLLEALDIQTELTGLESATSLDLLVNLASVRRDRGAFIDAIAPYRQVLEIQPVVRPIDTELRAHAFLGLGRALAETGALDEAGLRLQEASAAIDSLGAAKGYRGLQLIVYDARWRVLSGLYDDARTRLRPMLARTDLPTDTPIFWRWICHDWADLHQRAGWDEPATACTDPGE